MGLWEPAQKGGVVVGLADEEPTSRANSQTIAVQCSAVQCAAHHFFLPCHRGKKERQESKAAVQYTPPWQACPASLLLSLQPQSQL